MPASSRAYRGFSIRTKLLFLILALLFIPWTGYHYVREMEHFLLKGQEDALMLMARSIATLLNDRPELFSSETGIPEPLGNANDTLVQPLPENIRVDGDSADWSTHIDSAINVTSDQAPHSLSFRYLVGYRGAHLYALFQVTDDHLVFRDEQIRRLDNSDHLRLTLEDPQGQLRRYILTARAPGRMSVYEVNDQWQYPLTGTPVRDIIAVLSPTAAGYNIELRIPRTMISGITRATFSIVDVDDPKRRTVEHTLAAPTNANPKALGHVLLHSPEIAKILNALDQPVARIWVLDKQRRVRAVVGSLTPQPSTWREEHRRSKSIRRQIADLLNTFYQRFMDTPTAEFTDISPDVSHRSDKILLEVLAGHPRAQRRSSTDKKAEIIMAAFPIRDNGKVRGAVVVEQAGNEIQSFQNEIVQSIATITLFVFVFLTTALLIFASRITIRIGRLRNATERAIAPEGRVRQDCIPPDSSAGDEIGDLSRSISSMLRRLAQYTCYLEGMPDILAHELNNPLNVVNSSLENLASQDASLTDNKYVIRARNGINRLRSILVNLTDAANLEEAMQAEAPESFDLVELAKNVVDGYRLAHRDRTFEVHVMAAPLVINGSPDHIAQLLDKLVDNASDFGVPATPIYIRLDRLLDDARVTVLNEGQCLPETMGDRLFDPMVSVGTKNATQSHLGLGLFVVRLITEYHRGSVWATNRDDVPGVAVTVSLPLVRA